MADAPTPRLNPAPATWGPAPGADSGADPSTAPGAAALGAGPALRVRGLQVRLGHGAWSQEVLCGLDLDLPAGAWTCVVGPNGAGKSTLLRALAGVLDDAQVQGQIALWGRPLAQIAPPERARQLAWLGQGGAGLGEGADDLCAYDVALLGRLPHHGWWSPPSAADHAVVQSVLRQVQAWDWACKPLGQLSGGERQRVLLARALAVQAPLLLMDEPLANLDPPHQADWLALVRAQVAGGGTVLSVLHELNVALAADRLVVLRGGRVLACGAPGDAAVQAALLHAFDARIRLIQTDAGWVALPTLPTGGGT